MNKKEFDSIIKQPPNIRYEYFIKKVADEEEVWGLYDDGWAIAQDDSGNKLIPFFPKKELSEYYAINEWNKFKAEPIDLYEFIQNWLVGMKKDKVKPSIFPINEDSVMVEIDVLLCDLTSELEKY